MAERRQGSRDADINRRVMFGARDAVLARAHGLPRSKGRKGTINTASGERHNLTLREENGRVRHKTLAFSKKRREFQHPPDFWRAYANVVRARRQRGLRLWARFLAPTTLALWLALGAVSAQPRPAALVTGEGVQGREADPVVQNSIDEGLRAFEDLLAVSRSAAARYSHRQVELASWRGALAAWEKASAALPAPAQGLQRCWPPLQKARSLVEQAHQLFLQAAADTSNPRALELLLEHEDLRKQAEGPLQEAEACYRAARDAYRTR